MGDNYLEQLPAGWVLKHKIRRDGTVESFYHNSGTGQKFKTREELNRFVNYRIDISPCLHDLRECYGNGRGGYKERPWETDPVYSFNDYALGRVGKVKEKYESRSSCLTATNDASDMEESSQQQGKGESGKGKGKTNK